jgi:hypothetical protein
MKTLIPLLAALAIGAGSLKAELPAGRAAELNELARISFLGLSGVLFLGAAGIIAGGIRELAYARRLGKECNGNWLPTPGDATGRLENDTEDAPLGPELEHGHKLYLAALQRGELTQVSLRGSDAVTNDLRQGALSIRAAEDQPECRLHRLSDSLSRSFLGLDWDPAI